MATTTHITLEQYLKTTYEPDAEYVDGEVRERNVGKWEHARLQALLAAWFLQHETEWGVMASTEQRTRTSPARIRAPDLVVVMAGPQPDVLVAPPLLIVEILSPDDTYSELEDRTRDYMRMGGRDRLVDRSEDPFRAHVRVRQVDLCAAARSSSYSNLRRAGQSVCFP